MNLGSLPLSDLDGVWRTRVASLPETERAALLVEADALFRGGRDDRRRALSCWLALRDSLDPARPADRPRIHALLVGVPPGIEDLLPLARRAEAGSGDGDGEGLRWAAAIYIGRAEGDLGHLESAEQRFRAVLARFRGTGDPAEYLACSSLATLCLRGNREYEALVLSRHLVRLSGEEEGGTRVRFARTMLAGALVRLEEWDLLREEIGRIDGTLEGRAEPYERTVRFYCRAFAARRFLALGDRDAAAREVERAAAVARRGLSLEAEERTLLLLRARCAEAAGSLREAEAHLLAARDSPGPRPVASLEVLGDLARVRADLRGPAAAVEAAREALDVLESEGVARHGTGQVLATAGALGALLRARCGGVPEATRAFDVAARAALGRIREINRCLAEFPELASIEAVDERVLHAHRRRFVREHGVLLEHIRDRLRAEGGSESLPSFFREGTYFRVCAWCARILGSDGAWVPVAHYLPVGPDLPVSHGICPACAGSFLPG